MVGTSPKEGRMSFVLAFIAAFLVMEPIAWFLHKYLMHGPLWFIHEDHHKIDPNKKFQLNDTFAIVFVIPSVAGIYFGGQEANLFYSGIGYGIMFYGAVYFYIHEVLIHKRYKLFKTPDNRYIHWLSHCHRRHHAEIDKHYATDFGMIFLNNFILDRRGRTQKISH